MATATIQDRSLWTVFDVWLGRTHLDTGLKRNCKWCPLALAVKEAVGSWRFVDVAADGRIIVRHPSGRHVEVLVEDPEHLEWLVSTIDAGRAAAIEEQTFRIRCPFPPLADVDVHDREADAAALRLALRFRR